MKKATTKREAIMVIILIIVASVMGYFYLRYRPQSGKLKSIVSKNKQLQKDIDSFKLKKEPRVSSKSLQGEIDQINAVLKPVEEKIRAFKNQFASLDSPENSKKITVEISSLAKRHNVLITENVPYVNAAKPATQYMHSLNILGHLYEKKDINRPLRKITLRARYLNLLRFMEGISHLSSRVAIVRVNLDVVQGAKLTTAPQIIIAKLILII